MLLEQARRVNGIAAAFPVASFRFPVRVLAGNGKPETGIFLAMTLLEDLTHKINTELGVSDWFEIDQDRIDAFADATEDHQWIHVDEEKASAGPFGTTIAHGYLTLSLLPHLAPGLELEGVRMGVNYGLDKLRFITPVPSGSRIRMRSVLRDVKEVPGGVQIKAEVTVELEGSEKPAAVAEALTRLYV